MEVQQKDLFKLMGVEIEENLEVYKKQNNNCDIQEVKYYSPGEIKKIRHKLNMSQRVFAKVMGSSVRAIEYWENGKKKPSGAANRLLQLLEMDPNFIVDYGFVKQKE
ncbi:helix-turn-helix domain-containing protein [Listeria seeligeri]|uniref:helix-turn-helix domain-containing protein n=1 Tax=Listeria seeligeri TaxID=1640 RepID=UPI0016265256|nr:type II toxin-antitoxin system MqsA family antitoxin [Listeria seeligeri]MBC1746901.1 type II toxin-antitoxin system MqsA family antitoxin [Listeria seeligeri]MBC2233040.1 type II toxin-antitoxin system MqsA family antitoxin [Listeria seeligeri]MBF2626130.1 type II toxin-antitoxin system MqsA family antitoxin [Listeria seeligeri]MBF2673476.1 type II toxin-antitoxin system MqsA family antitoxin [Listeria seeligeri]